MVVSLAVVVVEDKVVGVRNMGWRFSGRVRLWQRGWEVFGNSSTCPWNNVYFIGNSSTWQFFKNFSHSNFIITSCSQFAKKFLVFKSFNKFGLPRIQVARKWNWFHSTYPKNHIARLQILQLLRECAPIGSLTDWFWSLTQLMKRLFKPLTSYQSLLVLLYCM